MSIKNKKHLIIPYFLKEMYLKYVLCILNSNLIRTNLIETNESHILKKVITTKC